MSGIYIQNMEMPTGKVATIEIHPDGSVFTLRGRGIGNAVQVEDMRPTSVSGAKELSKPGWIPVTERLPEHSTSVIVHRKDGGIFIWEYFDNSQTDECWIDDSMNVYSFYDVTHWMPLPEPPKEE